MTPALPTVEMQQHLQNSQHAPTLWVIVGATGTGKTALSLELSDRLLKSGIESEIINADAMQLYRGMNIGTAKIGARERRGIPHHLFDALEPSEEATVAWYQPTARGLVEQVFTRGRDAILVGGSGLYVSSVVFDFQFPPRDADLRSELESRLEAGGVEPLLEQLRGLDPAVADAVDNRNPRRVIRALEVALLGGNAQVTLPSEPEPWRTRTRFIGLRCPRGELVHRLDARTENMWASGLLDEVRQLIPNGIERGKTASRAIGYAQALAQLKGEVSEAEAIAEAQVLTRRYARRQVSWFKRYANVEWLDAPGFVDDVELFENI